MNAEQGLKQNSNRKFTGLLTGTNRKLNTRRGVIFPHHKVSMKKLWWRKSDCESRRQTDSQCWPELQTRWKNSVVSDKGSKIIWGAFVTNRKRFAVFLSLSLCQSDFLYFIYDAVKVWQRHFIQNIFPLWSEGHSSLFGRQKNYTTTITTTEHYFIFVNWYYHHILFLIWQLASD